MRLVQVAAAVVAGAAVLAGCSAGETANATLPSASSSAAETTEGLPPLGPPDMPMPDEAREQTAAGAEAFTYYYVRLINRLQQTLDGAPLRTFSSSCDTCNRIADDADRDQQAGYTYRGGTLIISSIGEATLNGVDAELAFIVDQEPLDVLDPAGVAIDTLSSPLLKGLPGGVSLTWNADHWLASSLSFG